AASAARRALPLPDAHAVADDVEINLGVRKQPEPLADLERNRDLSLGRNQHGITPTSNTTPEWPTTPATPAASPSRRRTCRRRSLPRDWRGWPPRPSWPRRPARARASRRRYRRRR